MKYAGRYLVLAGLQLFTASCTVLQYEPVSTSAKPVPTTQSAPVAGQSASTGSVVDATAGVSSNTGVTPPAASKPVAPPTPVASVTGELVYQLQVLQEEVAQLRGSLEEQQHLLDQLKQQRLDDYMSLDRRIAELSAQPKAAQPEEGEQSGVAAPSKAALPVASQGEQEAYRAAYSLVKEKQFQPAKQAFTEFLQNHPDGALAPNAYYWLGELHLLDQEFNQARQRFSALLQRYPDHQKAPDAMFKLAKVHHLQGDNDEAKKLLEQVVSQYQASGATAAGLAQDYLNQHFK